MTDEKIGLIDEVIEMFWELWLHPEDHPKLIFGVLIALMVVWLIAGMIIDEI